MVSFRISTPVLLVAILFHAARIFAADPLGVVSAASYTAAVSSESIASGFAANVANTTLVASGTPLPLSLGGTTVSVLDNAGVTRPAPIFSVSPKQVNFQIPAQTAVGTATVTITSGDGNVASGTVPVSFVSPGFFAANANGQGAASAVVVQVAADGTQTASNTYTCGSTIRSCVPTPIAVSPVSGQTVLELYGTGIRGRNSMLRVRCTVGGTAVQVMYAGAQGSNVGLDQVNVVLPPSLAGRGQLTVVLTVENQATNAVLIDTGTVTGPGVTFYVAPNGNDTWSGGLAAPNSAGTDGPFATLSKAQQAVRTALRSSGSSGPIYVTLRAGTYNQQLTLATADSGTVNTPVIWQNYPGESPVISGGRQVTGWTPSTSIPGAWQASVAGLQPFEQLWVNGQRRYRVQVPSTGYFYNLGPVYVTTAAGCTNPSYSQGYSPSLQISDGKYECFDRFFFKTGDIDPNWSGLADTQHPIEVVDFENWTVARMRLLSIGPSAGIAGAPANSSVAYLAGATVTGAYWGFLTGQRYLITNVKEALSSTAAGQWFADADSSGKPTTLTYIPVAGEDFANGQVSVMAPQIAQLLVATATGGLSYVTFRGVTFSYTNWIAGSPGYSGVSGSQSASREAVPAAISLSRAAHIVFDLVTVSHAGGWGLEFIGTNGGFVPNQNACGIQNTAACSNQVINSVFTDLGSGAIRLGTDPVATDQDAGVTQYNLIYNNVLAGGDRMVPGTAITVENSHHNVIDHNDIYDFYNQGINIGRALNFDAGGLPNLVHDNQITYNHMYNLGQGVTSDIGAVHMASGLQTGNLIQYNRFHDIAHDPGPGGYGGWGIYLDQGSSFVTAMFNAVYNTSAAGLTYNRSLTGTYQLNGTPNVIANNIFAYGAPASLSRIGDDGALNFTFKNNIVYWDTQVASPQSGTWTCAANPPSCFAFAQNMYYATADPTMASWRFLAQGSQFTLALWQASPAPAEDLGSLVNTDPLFVCPGSTPCADSPAYNFNLQSGSKALSLINFQPFDPSEAGRANPVITPVPVPAAFPLQIPKTY